jgi:lipopolysaccharide transport system ATP-binding protein
MVGIKLIDASVTIPIYNATSRSLTSRLLSVLSGNRLDSQARDVQLVSALSNLNLDLSVGDRLGILGRNGAGKTTLLRVLSGVYKPTSGKAQINGKVESLIDISLGINPEATGRENIFIRARLLGLTKKQVDSRISQIIDFAELGTFIDLPVRTYSSGMHLRLSFAVSTVLDPDILIMDEWLSVGDESFQQKAESKLLSMIDKAKILVLASHSKSLIQATCNKVLVLDGGKIVFFGEVEQGLGVYFT